MSVCINIINRKENNEQVANYDNNNEESDREIIINLKIHSSTPSLSLFLIFS
jgi:hypothetical protein